MRVEGAIEGLAGMPQERKRPYSNLIAAVLREACRRGLLEKTMLETLNEKYKDILQTLWKEGLDEGLDKGRDEGEAKGKAESILMILQARGLPIPKEAEDRIRSCRDQERLGQWLLQALRVSSADEFSVP